MVKSMTLSLQVPHMVYSDEINVDALTEIRDSLRPLATEMGVTKKLSHMPFFIKATSLALLRYPVLNSTIDVENMTLTYHAEQRIGVAVDTERGLTVPVIGDCKDKSVLEIALELNRLYKLVSIQHEYSHLLSLVLELMLSRILLFTFNRPRREIFRKQILPTLLLL